jgi:hypothetical protein
MHKKDHHFLKTRVGPKAVSPVFGKAIVSGAKFFTGIIRIPAIESMQRSKLKFIPLMMQNSDLQS